MIEVKLKNADDVWTRLFKVHKRKKKDFTFALFDYRINGKVYTEWTDEWEKELKREKLWSLITN